MQKQSTLNSTPASVKPAGNVWRHAQTMSLGKSFYSGIAMLVLTMQEHAKDAKNVFEIVRMMLSVIRIFLRAKNQQ